VTAGLTSAPNPELAGAVQAALFIRCFPLPPVRLSMRARLLASSSLAAALSAFPIHKPQGEDR